MTTSVRIACVLALFLAACSGSSGGAVIVAESEDLRIVGTGTGGASADELAAALVFGTGFAATRSGRADFSTVDDAALRVQLAALARDHLWASGLVVGNGGNLAGSSFVRRLAAATNAPTDTNFNGSNLDETMAVRLEELADLAGGVLPDDLTPIVMPWSAGSAEFSGEGSATKQGNVGTVDLAQLGRAILARVAVGGGLLSNFRGSLPGANADDGVLGLLLMQEAIAMEETIFGNLFTQGLVLDGMPFPDDYRPANGLRWVPREVKVGADINIPDAPASYTSLDHASDLEVLAVLLRAGAELAFLASDSNPNTQLRDLFQKGPFSPPTSTGPNQFITWESGVRALFAAECNGCHSGPFPSGGFRSDTYDAVHLGGTRSSPTSSNPIIVRGDKSKSLLYLILTSSSPSGFEQMPYLGPYLSSTNVALVGDWIDDGARSAPPGPPKVGADLAATMLKNLVAMHLGPDGVLYERHEGDSAVGRAVASSTGAALQAMAALWHMESDLPDLETTLQSAADFAAATFVDAQGNVAAEYDAEIDVISGGANLLGHARIATGLLAAGRVLGDSDLSTAGALVGQRVLSGFFDDTKSLFATVRGSASIQYTPEGVAAVVDMLRELDEGDVFEEFLKRLLPVLAFSELGEVLGDGIADTDGDGLPEPRLAGGPFGRAPLLTGLVREGPTAQPVEQPITWSTHIQPLFRSKCARCHMSGASEGDYRIDTPRMLVVPGSPSVPMPIVVPGDPENSFLYRKLVDRSPSQGDQMPLQTPPLSPSGKEMVRRWILEGASSR